MNALLIARNLHYGPPGRPRLQHFDMQLQPGDRLALLGTNGAGKSTLLGLLAGVAAADRGEVLLHGRQLRHAPIEWRSRVGYLPQQLPLYPELSLRENLIWAGQLQGLRGRPLAAAVDAALDRLELAAMADRLAGLVSTGMRQRLGLAQALLHQPSLLLLDEPTAGLDPLQTEVIHDLIRGLDGRLGLILATHLLEDVRALCNRAIVLDAGRKIADQSVDAQSDLMAHFRPAERRSQP